ncbi:hypothetical protein OAS19_05605 [Altererythrobacter sp.]|nr:hypothetical protein [Altererythrobacter sp.]
MMRAPVLVAAFSMTACQPPATDDYVERMALDDTQPPASLPLPSPDTEGAIWAPAGTEGRLLYGIPGQTPFLAVQCDSSGSSPELRFTRFSPADRDAQAMMALVGNSHVERLPVDAIYNGRAWLWEGSARARDPDMDVLTGPRSVEATIPGAGSLILNPSPLTRDLVNACRAIGGPPPEEAEREPQPFESPEPD